MSGNSTTLATDAYVRLRSDIIGGIVRPGVKIATRATCERLGIGLSPMREALNRLVSEGLVEQSDRRGFTAAPLSVEDLTDLTLARSALNAAALRDAIRHGKDAWEEAIVTARHRLHRARRLRTPFEVEVEQKHRAFHAALLAACRSQRLKRSCEQMFDAADRYRLASRAVDAGSRDVDREHDEITHATLGRQEDIAVALLDAHVERTAELARQVLQRRNMPG